MLPSLLKKIFLSILMIFGFRNHLEINILNNFFFSHNCQSYFSKYFQNKNYYYKYYI